MPSSQAGSRRRTAVAVGLALLAAAALAWLTVVCLFTTAEYELSPDRMRGGHAARVRNLPVPPPGWPGGPDLALMEDGTPLGPPVAGPAEVRRIGGGAFAVEPRGGSPLAPLGIVHFSSSDDTSPRTNGRRYVLRVPRRQLPGSLALLLTVWIVVAVAAHRFGGRSWRSGGGRGAVRPWSLAVMGGTFTLFALQAWLPRANGTWLLAVAAAGLAPGLARLAGGRWSSPPWLPCLAGLALWIALSSLWGSPHASPATAFGFLAVAAGGWVLYQGQSAALEGEEGRGDGVLPALFGVAAALVLARYGGLDPAPLLAPLQSGPSSTRGVINLWTSKFAAHWLLVLGWCAVAALDRGRHRREIAAVAGLAALALAITGPRSAALALVLSATVAGAALRWPAVARRLVVGAVVAGLLTAPLLAAGPWALRERLSSTPGGAAGGLAGETRAGIWEYSRRQIAERPVAGWGFGASGHHPGRRLPLAEALGLDARGSDPELGRHPALAGGHPHNGALLAWFDLGLVGVLLLAGMVLAVGRSIAAVQGAPGVHAALLGLLTTTVTFLAFNYPAWRPEIAALLWMGPILASAVLPPPSPERPRVVTGWWVAAALVTLGGGVLLLVGFVG